MRVQRTRIDEDPTLLQSVFCHVSVFCPVEALAWGLGVLVVVVVGLGLVTTWAYLCSPCDRLLSAWFGVWFLCGAIWRQAIVRFRSRVPQLMESMAIIMGLTLLWCGNAYLTQSVTCSETSSWFFSLAKLQIHLAGLVLVVRMVLLFFPGTRAAIMRMHRPPMMARDEGMGRPSLMLYFDQHGELFVARRGWLDMSPAQAMAASPDTICKMAVVDFDRELFADPQNPQDSRPSRTCCICLSQYNEHKTIVKTPCGHYMHKQCLEECLQVRRHCPICRTDVQVACQRPCVNSSDSQASMTGLQSAEQIV